MDSAGKGYNIDMEHLCVISEQTDFLQILNRGSALTELRKLMKSHRENKLERKQKNVFNNDPGVFVPSFSTPEPIHYREDADLTVTYEDEHYPDDQHSDSYMLHDINFNEQHYDYSEEETTFDQGSFDAKVPTTVVIQTTSPPMTTTTTRQISVTPNPTQISRREMFQQRRAERRDRRKLCKGIKEASQRSACLEDIREEMQERNTSRTEPDQADDAEYFLPEKSVPLLPFPKVKKSGHSSHLMPKIDVQLNRRDVRHVDDRRRRNLWKRQTFSQEAINRWKMKSGLIAQSAEEESGNKVRDKRNKREATIFDDIEWDLDGDHGRAPRSVHDFQLVDATSLFADESSGYFSENVSEDPSEWLERMLLEVSSRREATSDDKELLAALDTIARYILGEERVAAINTMNERRVKTIRSQTCNATSPSYYNSTMGRKSRAMVGGSDGAVDPEDIWDTVETGTLLIESDQGKKTTVYFKTLTSKTTFGTDASVIAVLCSLLGFLVLCVVVLVARHHGRSIARSLDPTGVKSRSAHSQDKILPDEDSYERRLAKKRAWQQQQDELITAQINDGVANWNQKKAQKNQVLPVA